MGELKKHNFSQIKNSSKIDLLCERYNIMQQKL